jgi:hypothetical protein
MSSKRTRIAAAGRVRNGDLKPLKIGDSWACVDCRTSLPQNTSGLGGKARPMLRCVPCRHERNQYREAVKNAAYRAVAEAIASGLLRGPKGQPCADCQAPATTYDHRDYTQPLEVDAVCRSCNVMRGPADVWPPFTSLQPSLPAGAAVPACAASAPGRPSALRASAPP